MFANIPFTKGLGILIKINISLKNTLQRSRGLTEIFSSKSWNK